MIEKDIESRNSILVLITFSVIMLLFVLSLSITGKGNKARQKESLEKALNRDVTYCYATTGRYPRTLDYIERVYGLTYDKELFEIDYVIKGSRIPPEITISEKGAKNE